MASITKQANGRRTIQFTADTGKRYSIRLGKISQRNAEAIKARVERILEAQFSRQALDADTAQWLGEIDDSLHSKLAKVGLVEAREQKAVQALGPFLDAYVESRTDVKPLTIRHLREAAKKLKGFFGEDVPLENITPGDADDFRRHLLIDLADNTVRRMCGRAKQFFRAALRKRLIPENPFEDMRNCTVTANRSRDYFLPLEDAERILDACPNAEWRLIFALARFGGLRCPSEHVALRWEDVDWERSRMRIRSPKTEHHEGKDSRVIPIFPELRPHLDAVWEQTESGTVYVINRYRDAEKNLRTQLTRIIKRAGLEPWPKLFQNLRATRETELAQTFPIHVVCEWIGNTATIAQKHYLRITDADFDRAIQSGAKSGAGAVQNPVQTVFASPLEKPRHNSPKDFQPDGKPYVVANNGEFSKPLPKHGQYTKMPPQGLEP